MKNLLCHNEEFGIGVEGHGKQLEVLNKGKWGNFCFRKIILLLLFTKLFPALCDHMNSSVLCYLWSLLKLMSIESVMPSNHHILCQSLLLLSSIFSKIRVFSSESALQIQWPKGWSFSFSTTLSNEYWELISLRIDWLISLQSKGLSRIFPSTRIQKHQFFSAQLSL